MRERRLPRRRLDRLVNDRLGKVLRSAYSNVPYYREMMDAAGYDPVHEYGGTGDLERLKITKKEAFKRAGPEAFINRRSDLSCCICDSTSGSTGIPCKVFRSKYEEKLNMAKWLSVLFVNGYSVRQKVMALCAPGRMERGRCFVQKLGFLRRLPVDYLHTSARQMVDMMTDYRPDVLYGNRSHIEAMALEMKRRGITYGGLNILIVTGEIIRDSTRKLCRESFGTDLIESYGCVETGVIAFETPERDGLRPCEDLILIEYLDEEGHPAKQGDICRIVMTDLAGTVMPFIRYDIGDLVRFRLVREKDGSNGRRITEIIGRDGEFAIMPDGTKRFVYDFSVLIKKYEDIHQFQVIQKEPGRFLVLVNADKSYYDMIHDDLGKSLVEHFGQSSRFVIERTDRIGPGSSGKIKLFMSQVDTER